MSWKREDKTHLALEGDDLVVRRYQDAEDIAERAKMLREQPQHKDFHHKWSLPNVMVDAFYQEYNGGWKNSLGDQAGVLDQARRRPLYGVTEQKPGQHAGEEK